MSIPLQTLLPIDNLKEYKLHLACYNQSEQPLDVFVRNRSEWEGWNAYRGKKNDFNRRYIYSLIDFYPERDIWLFGGIYEVLTRYGHQGDGSYDITLSDDLTEYIGRLKVHFPRPSRATRLKLENHYNNFSLSEILKECYSGEEFCGFNNINHDFKTIQHIIQTNRPGWRDALKNVKGIYLITDKINGKRYVGCAYGDSGIWSRWESYINTGHGGNDELLALIKEKGIDYARNNFVFSILEHMSFNADDAAIIYRENHWKNVLLTRGKYGYNAN